MVLGVHRGHLIIGLLMFHFVLTPGERVRGCGSGCTHGLGGTLSHSEPRTRLQSAPLPPAADRLHVNITRGRGGITRWLERGGAGQAKGGSW